MKLQNVYSFPYNNYFSNFVFDESETIYCIEPGEIKNNEIVNCKISSISTSGKTNVLMTVDGIINEKTLKINRTVLLFGVCKRKTHKVCAYHLNGSFIWEVPFENPIWDVNCISNGNIVVTTCSGTEKTLTWLSFNGAVIKTHIIGSRFVSIISNNNCVFLSTENRAMVCDFDGNIKKTVNVGHTVYSMWESYSNNNNVTANIVVTSKNAIYTLDLGGNVINEYNLQAEQQSKWSNAINLYGLNSVSDNICYVMQNDWLSSKLLKIDMMSNNIIAEYNSKKKFMNTPLVTKQEKVVAVMNSNSNSVNCIVFDGSLNELHKTKVYGEVFKIAVIDDNIYMLILNKKSNKIDICSVPIQ